MMRGRPVVCLAAVWAAGLLVAAVPVRRKVVLEVMFDPAAPEIEKKLEPVFKFAKAYETHAFAFQKTKKEGLAAPRYEVLGASGSKVYAGSECTMAEEAVVLQLTDLPIPGSLCPVLPLSKFKADRRKLEWLGTPMEGFALSKYKEAAKSKKPELRSEGQAILDALAKRQEQLEGEIADELIDAKPEALRDMRLYKATWPKAGAKKYAAKIAELSADAEVKAASDLLMKKISKKGRK